MPPEKHASLQADTSPAGIAALARQHGLVLQPATFEFNETGLDFQVVQALDEDGQPWILRLPRRADVLPRAANESKVLQLLQGRLPVAVPGWRIYTDTLIAYPRLAGSPVADIDMVEKRYIWHLGPDNLPPVFISSLARAMAALHAITPEAAAGAGLRVSTPRQVRGAMAQRMDLVKKEVGVAESLWQQWQAWLAEDQYWPRHSCLVHGDLQAAHILVEADARVTGLLDWTEAEVSDPAIDFVVLLAAFGEQALQALLAQYQLAGGRTWPLMAKHIQQRQAAYGVNIALFVLESGQPDYLDMARNALGLPATS